MEIGDDIKMAFTGVGPHRANLRFRMNGKELKTPEFEWQPTKLGENKVLFELKLKNRWGFEEVIQNEVYVWVDG